MLIRKIKTRVAQRHDTTFTSVSVMDLMCLTVCAKSLLDLTKNTSKLRITGPVMGRGRCITLTKGQYCGKISVLWRPSSTQRKSNTGLNPYHLLRNKWMFETPTMLDPIKINDCDHISYGSVHCGQEFGRTSFRRLPATGQCGDIITSYGTFSRIQWHNPRCRMTEFISMA